MLMYSGGRTDAEVLHECWTHTPEFKYSSHPLYQHAVDERRPIVACLLDHHLSQPQVLTGESKDIVPSRSHRSHIQL
jgi:hypothetical protein